MCASTSSLSSLPAELVLRILDFADVASVASFTRTSRDCHKLEETHQQAIYSSPSKTAQPPNNRDLGFLNREKSFAKYYDGTANWKEACKRQTLLRRNWDSPQPITCESILKNVHTSRVWRFRPDFKRRLFIATSEHGGLQVTCMDTGERLWKLSMDEVRPCAHLEYQESSGTAVFDRHGDAVEVWKINEAGERGEFKRAAILQHDCMTRGFQLSYDTLCVVSSEGKGFVYDMEPEPVLRTTIKIALGAVGHLDQNEEVVMYSLGEKGYHVHDKTTGQRLGVINPGSSKSICHIEDPEELDNYPSSKQQTPSPQPRPSRRRARSLQVRSGHLRPQGPDHFETDAVANALNFDAELDGDAPHLLAPIVTPLQQDEWGAGMLDGSLMVGISAGSRTVVCPDWRAALAERPVDTSPRVLGDDYLEARYGQDEDEGHKHMTVIECEQLRTPDHFHLGGWLSIRNNRVLFPVGGRVYVLALDNKGEVIVESDGEDQGSNPRRSSYCISTSSIPGYAPPVSFMGIYDDCIMSTHATVARVTGRNGNTNLLRAKGIRVLCFAPDPKTGGWDGGWMRLMKWNDKREGMRRSPKADRRLEAESDEIDEVEGQEGEYAANAEGGEAVIMSLLELLQQYR